MDATTMQSYQGPDGDYYQHFAALYGQSSADAIAAAARTGDNNGEVAAAIAQAKYGAPLDTSTTDAFVNQVVNDPLGATTSWLNTLFGNTFLSFIKSPWVLLAIFCVFFVVWGGPDYIKRKLNKA